MNRSLWLALALAACARENAPPAPADGASSPADPPAATPSEPGPAPTPPDTGWTVRDTEAPATGGVAVLTAVRVAANQGFDRLVLEFAGDTLPGIAVSYVDKPQHQCGSGEEVWLEGDAWLSVRLEPAQAHTDSGEATVRNRHWKPALPNLLEVRLICDYEAQVEWVAGVRSPEGYRVLRLSRPARLVVDIRHPRGGGPGKLQP